MRRPKRAAPLVDAWFDLLPAAQQPLARLLHGLVLDAAPQLVPAVRWGTLAYLGTDAALMTLAPQRGHLRLHLAQGATLAARFPELEGPSPTARWLRIGYDDPVDRDLLRELVRAAVALDASPRDPQGDGA
ncbi:MAG: DUF1801 domain-containing protein [Gammaproteobacteria bacterium]|uniref:DUF1801 domain-containing protein n=1 Tax=Azohydromonas sp. TaxID=1872666 RepID=UPI002BFCC060|nr:DUF1801 domain-containing protein [Azohydromonas sp.]HMM84222.1 DUF1801 domain-containing protein [Azohydromonas sp.]